MYYSLRRMKIGATFKIFTIWIKFAFLFALSLKLIFQAFTVIEVILKLVLARLVNLLNFFLLLNWLRLLLLRLFLLLLLFRSFLSTILSLLSLLTLLFSLFSQLFGATGNKFFNLFLLSLFLIFLSELSISKFFSFSLPLDDFFWNKVDSFRIFDTCSNIFLKFGDISLAIEIGIKKNSKISI